MDNNEYLVSNENLFGSDFLSPQPPSLLENENPTLGLTSTESAFADPLNQELELLSESINEIGGTVERDRIEGTSAADKITGGFGGDTITGGGGKDIFVYTNIRDAMDIIEDFELNQDKIDFSTVLASVGYEGNEPIADGYITFEDYSQGTIISLDGDGVGGRDGGRSYLKVKGVTSEELASNPHQICPAPEETVQLSPEITIPGEQSVAEDDSLTISGITVIDEDGSVGELEVNLSLSNGVVSLGQTEGLTFTTGDGTEDRDLVFRGSLADLNAALDNVTYQGDRNFNGNDSLNLTVTDTGDPNLTDTKSIAIAVSPVNDAPVLTVPNAQTVAENTDLAIAGISVSDIDVGNRDLEVTISANNGLLSLASGDSLNFSEGDGSEDNTLTFIGSLEAINDALAELVYRGNAEFNGEDTIDIAVSDLGNRGAGGELTVTATIAISVIDLIESITINANLANDTGDSNSDLLTLDPTISGQVISDAAIVSLEANLNGNGFVDISSGLAADKSFTVSITEYEALTATLPDGDYSIDLRATDSNGLVSNIDTVEFTLDRTEPPITLELALESDTGIIGDSITTERVVTLIGQTEPGLTVVLVETGQQVVADSEGNFSFNDVPLAIAGDKLFTAVTQDAAANQGRASQTVAREGVNGAPEIISTPELVFNGESQTTYNYPVEAIDPDGDDLTYTLLNATNGAEIDENGNLSFTPGTDLEPFYDFTVQVDDGRGGTDVQEFTVEIPSIDDLGRIKGITWEDLNESGARDSALVQGANPDVVYVLDVSGSADFGFAGSPIGDFNDDGLENTRLDAEIAAFIALNEELNDQGLGEQAQISIVVYSGFTANADMDLVTDGLQLTTTPGADSNNDGTTDVEGILRSIRSGAFGVGNNTGTNPEAALQKVEETFTTIGTEAGNGNLIFLTDGYQNRGSSINGEVERLRGQGFNLSAFGVGNDASLSVIQTIDPDGIRFASIDEILEAFGGVGEGSQSVLEPLLAGVSVYLDSNNNGVLDPDEPVQVTAEDNPTTPDIDETGQYEFNNLVAGTYTVREVVPEGFEQTFPVSSSESFIANGDFSLGDTGFSAEREALFQLDVASDPRQFNRFAASYGDHTTGDGLMLIINGSIDRSAIVWEQTVSVNQNKTYDFGLWVSTWFATLPGEFDILINDQLVDSFSAPADLAIWKNFTTEWTAGNNITEAKITLLNKQVEFAGNHFAFDDIIFTTPEFDPYTVELSEGEVVENIDFGNVLIDSGLGNIPPRIVSQPIDIAFTGVPYQYNVAATDFNGDELTYTLLKASEGMAISDTGEITWDTGAIGIYEVEIQVDDGNGGIVTQAYELNVTEVPVDDEPPTVNLGFNSTVFNPGATVNLQIQGFDDVGIADLDLTFNGESLTLDPDIAQNGLINNAAVTLDEAGVFEVVATATDLAGNLDTETLSIRVLDPTDNEAPIIEIDTSEIDPFDPVIDSLTDVIGTVTDDNLEFYRVELAPTSLIDLNNPAANDPDYITIAEGNSNVVDNALGTIDPNLYRNDSYFVRVYAQDYSGNINAQGIVLGLNSQTKPGDFSLEFTDLSIPVAGVPLEITRRYSSLDANFQGDFGYGWELGLRDADIVEAATNGKDLSLDDFFGGNSFTIGTRVTLNTPDGRRVGFTFDPVLDGGGFLGARYAPRFVPDAGVYETLEVPYTPLTLYPDGSVGLYSFGLTFNPSEYTLTAKDGTVYNYHQNEGLQMVEDRNGNTLTFSDDGIESSTGVEVDFIRDNEGRITEIVDPEGESIVYDYDTNGDLVGVTDREENQTTLKYEGARPHYLTELIDPLGRIGVRTEYDENGQISAIFDADGNALDIDYDSANSRSTVTDPFGNTTTFVFDDRGNVVSEIDAEGGITARTYDENNNLLTETDPEGNTISYTFDERGNQLSVTDAEGNVTQTTYNESNDVLTESDALGNTVTNTYDDNGNLTTRTDAEGNVTNYEYGNYGLLTSITDADGNESTFTYDNSGYITNLDDPTGGEISFTYDVNGNPTSLIDAEGNQFTTTYDTEGRITSRTDAEGNTTRTEYNSFGDKIADIDANSNRTGYRYSDRGLLIETIYPDSTPDNLSDNPRIINEYDALDRLIATTDEAGRKTHYIFDKLGRQTEIIYPDSTPGDLNDNPRMVMEYDSAGRVTAEIDELGNRTEFEYDAAGNIILQRDALGNETEFIYDAAGRQIALIDALDRQTGFVYNGLSQQTAINYADGTSETTTYDILGNIIAETDQNGITTDFEYDALGRLTAVIDALGQRTEYGLNVTGNIVSQTDANSNTTQFAYDSLGNRTEMILPLDQRSETAYDAVGNISSVTDFNGETITYEYDERNRLITTTLPDGEIESFTYTPTGQLATTTDERGVTTYTYDERDRLLSRTEPDGRIISYSYDDAGNILTLTVPSGTTNYTYDPLNRIATVTDPDAGITNYTYDPVSNLVTTEFPNGVTENREYDLLNRLTYLENRDSNNIISSFDYTLDAVGNRTQVEENNGRIVEYEYDDLYRLTQETITDSVNGNNTIEYTFDAVGNRLEKIDSVEGTTTYTYDANDRLISETLNGTVTEYQYDNDGNLIAQILDGETQATYEWSAKGELIAIEATEDGETGRIEYQYDTDGIRVAINIDGETTHFLIDKNQQQFAQVIEEYLTSGETTASYVHGIDLISQVQNGERTYYQVDGLGSTVNLTNINGIANNTYTYDAYGNLTRQVGSTPNNYLFAGEQFDSNLDGYYLRARYMDTAIGRFISRDPFEGFNNQPVTLHDYLYVGNNPINAIDPSGEVIFTEYSSAARQRLTLYSEATRNALIAKRRADLLNLSIESFCAGLAIAQFYEKYIGNDGFNNLNAYVTLFLDTLMLFACSFTLKP